MFDVSLNAIGIDAVAPDEEQIEAGAPPLVNLVVAAGTPLPFAGPDQQPIVVPTAQFRFNLTKEIALQYAEAIVNAADKLPDAPKESDLVIAKDPAAANRLAEQMEGFAGGRSGKK
jgi:hypothetical protein